MLEVDALSVRNGAFRLGEVSLKVETGACHAVLGPSGAGKTTLLHAILGVTPTESGRILLDGVEVTRLPIERRGVGYVPQQIGLFPHLTVHGNIAYSARARRVPVERFQPLLDRLVERTGIGPLLKRYPATLSGGERQRVALVRALASQPRLVLMDEPFGSLNESLRRELWWLVRELQAEYRLTVLLVSHDLTEAYTLADHVTILAEGRVLDQGETAEVFTRPAGAETARFLGIENVHLGHVLEVSEGLATVRVGDARLVALAPEHAQGEVLVSIRGEDVMLERAGPTAISARNRLPARVLQVRHGSPLYCVELDAGFTLSALVTRPACEELDLRPGMEVTAIIKAPSVHLIPVGGPGETTPART